jgi:hypothetical protein
MPKDLDVWADFDLHVVPESKWQEVEKREAGKSLSQDQGYSFIVIAEKGGRDQIYIRSNQPPAQLLVRLGHELAHRVKAPASAGDFSTTAAELAAMVIFQESMAGNPALAPLARLSHLEFLQFLKINKLPELLTGLEALRQMSARIRALPNASARQNLAGHMLNFSDKTYDQYLAKIAGRLANPYPEPKVDVELGTVPVVILNMGALSRSTQYYLEDLLRASQMENRPVYIRIVDENDRSSAQTLSALKQTLTPSLASALRQQGMTLKQLMISRKDHPEIYQKNGIHLGMLKSRLPKILNMKNGALRVRVLTNDYALWILENLGDVKRDIGKMMGLFSEENELLLIQA